MLDGLPPPPPPPPPADPPLTAARRAFKEAKRTHAGLSEEVLRVTARKHDLECKLRQEEAALAKVRVEWLASAGALQKAQRDLDIITRAALARADDPGEGGPRLEEVHEEAKVQGQPTEEMELDEEEYQTALQEKRAAYEAELAQLQAKRRRSAQPGTGPAGAPGGERPADGEAGSLREAEVALHRKAQEALRGATGGGEASASADGGAAATAASHG